MPKSDYKIKQSSSPKDIIKVEKVLLNLAYADFGSSSGPDFVATFEIILTNLTCHRIMNISIKDSMMGLKQEPGVDGELRPYFTNFDVLDTNSTLTPLPFDQSVLEGGQLVDQSSSFLEPCSITRLLVRIGGRGFLISESPVDGEPGNTERSKITMLLQNSCVVTGFIGFGGLDIVPIFPVYARSGVINGFKIRTALDDFSTTIPNPISPP
jgi:hypothetical protein